MIVNPSNIELTPTISLDLETTGLRAWQEKIDLIAIKTANEEYILEADKYTLPWLAALFIKISKLDKVILHNAKFDCGFIYKHYGVLLRNVHCTEMSAEICENGKQKLLRKSYNRPFSLTSVLKRWLHIDHADKEEKKSLQLSFTGTMITSSGKKVAVSKQVQEELKKLEKYRYKQMEYAMEDVRHLEKLAAVELERLEELELMTIYRLEHKLLPVLVKLEMEGCLIDKDGWLNLIKSSWEPELIKIENKLNEEVIKLLAGRAFKYAPSSNNVTYTTIDIFGNTSTMALERADKLSYTSPLQIIELFKFLKQPVPLDEEGKETVGEEALTVYLTEHGGSILEKFIEVLLEHRQMSKLISTYGYEFLANLDKENHVHTLYTQTKTETGRLSSKALNLQNIPTPPKGDLSKDVRRFFIARPGYKLITCDMSGAEIAIAADYSQEPILLGSIREGLDMHSQLASISYSIIFDKSVTISKSHEVLNIDGTEYIPEELRDEHKSVVFAKFYKGGAKRVYGVLSAYINKHCKPADRMNVAGAISKALDLKMPKLSEYLSGLITKAQKDGYLRTSSLGRIRWFESTVYGEAANAPIQGTNSEAIKMAMVKLENYFNNNGYGRIVMNIHDELVCEVKDEYVEEAAEKVKETMAWCLSYFLKTIKGGASVHISTHWKK